MQLVLFKPIDRALSDATIPGHTGPGSNGNEGVLCIPQSSSITGTSPSDCLVSYPGNLLGWGGVLPFCKSAVGVFYSPIRLGKIFFYSTPSTRSILKWLMFVFFFLKNRSIVPKFKPKHLLWDLTHIFPCSFHSLKHSSDSSFGNTIIYTIMFFLISLTVCKRQF